MAWDVQVSVLRQVRDHLRWEVVVLRRSLSKRHLAVLHRLNCRRWLAELNSCSSWILKLSRNAQIALPIVHVIGRRIERAWTSKQGLLLSSLLVLVMMVMSSLLLIFFLFYFLLHSYGLFMFPQSLLDLFPFLLKHGFSFLVNPVFFLSFSLLNLLIDLVWILVLRGGSLRSCIALFSWKIHYVWSICYLVIKLLLLKRWVWRHALSSRESYWNVIIRWGIVRSWILLLELMLLLSSSKGWVLL